MSLRSEHHDPPEAQKCGREANETERRLRRYAAELREQVARTWTQHYGDLRPVPPSAVRDANSCRLECWMTPVRWVQQRGPNCGLAVLAMAARPVLACEVAAGGAADGGGATNNGRDKLHDEVQNAMMRSVYDAHVKNTPWPKHICPPTLADLQQQAIAKGLSGRGEMFSAKAMASLAAEHQCGRYNVRLVEQCTGEKNSFQPKTDEFDDVDRKTFDDTHCSLNDLAIEILDSAKVPPCSNKHRVLTTKLDVSTWKKNIVERLMNGNLIAVCFDCDKNMMPCSTNDGHTAHWGLLCGVIVEMPRTKSSIQHRRRKSKTFPYSLNPTEFVGKNEISDDPNVNIYELLDQVHRDDSFNLNDDIGADVSLKKNNETRTKIFKKENPTCEIIQMLDPNRVWVVARHGKKGGRYAIWSLAELDSSNRQLRTPNDKILRTISPELVTKWKLNLHDRKRPPLNNSAGEEISVSLSHTTAASSFNHEQSEAHKLLSTFAPPLEAAPNFEKTKPLELASETKLTVELKHSGPLTSLLPPPPPPPPLPPILKPQKIPYYVLKPDENNDKTPFVLPEGPRLDHCLASRFVAFEPVSVPFFIADHVQYQLVNEDVKAHKLISPLLCHFSFFQKLDI